VTTGGEPREPDEGNAEAGAPDAAPDIEPDPRFSYANERTFLAWIRTALGLMTAGLAVTQLFPKFDVPGGRRLIGLPLIALGVLIALSSYSNWQRNERAMRRRQPLPKSLLPRIVAVVVGCVAVIGFVLVVIERGS
jgi:putative membrane protein